MYAAQISRGVVLASVKAYDWRNDAPHHAASLNQIDNPCLGGSGDIKQGIKVVGGGFCQFLNGNPF